MSAVVDTTDAAGGGQPETRGLLAKLMAEVRAEVRRDVLAFGPCDPVFGDRPCRVVGCGRTGRTHGLCVGHENRWRLAGRPPLEEWAAATDPTMTGYRALTVCQVPGCRYGRRGSAGLCRQHGYAWQKAGRPERDAWMRVQPVAGDDQPPACQIASCQVWAEPGRVLCATHHGRWLRLGRPEMEQFVRGYDDPPPPGYETIDLRPLPARLRLELQYALQCRWDDRRVKIRPASVQVIVTYLADSGVRSLLERTESTWRQDWNQRFNRTVRDGDYIRPILIRAWRAIDQLATGCGWEVEYPRDVWRLHTLGLSTGTEHLRFEAITQPWLKDLTKRWLRWRLGTGTSIGAAGKAVLAMTRFSRFLASPGIEATSPAQIDRALLERFLAELHTELAGRKIHAERIGQVNSFLQAIRLHGWDSSLPANAVFLAEDYPKRGQRLPRALAELVMSQLEDPHNLQRWNNPSWRLATLILIRCGLRVNDALRLASDCIVRDRDGAPYLRYFNHKMKREALVPIDDDLTAEIAGQRRRTLGRWPQDTPVLFPAPKANPAGTKPMTPTGYRDALRRWLRRCDIHDEHGQPVHLTPHQWRHTFATRLINRDVPQEVVRVLLDHESHAMTSHDARLSDTTVRRHWDQAHLVNANGETVTLEPGSPLATAIWAKQRLERATQALPNGCCGLPIQKSCPHANACLTCPMFITTVEYLPQHRQHHQQVLHLIATAQERNQTRLAQMNQVVAGNLQKIITALEDDAGQAEATADAC